MGGGLINYPFNIGIDGSGGRGGGPINQRHFDRKLRRYTYERFDAAPFPAVKSTDNGAAATGATGDINILGTPRLPIWQHILGAGQTIIVPTLTADGWEISGDQADNEGSQYSFGGDPNGVRGRHHYKIGTDAAFFISLTLKIGDASGTDETLFGLFKTQAFQTAHGSYTDFAAIGIVTAANPADIQIKTRLNSGAATTVDSTLNFADGETHTFTLLVKFDGTVVFFIDGKVPPVTQASFKLDATDLVRPGLFFLHSPDLADSVQPLAFEAGFATSFEKAA